MPRTRRSVIAFVAAYALALQALLAAFAPFALASDDPAFTLCQSAADIDRAPAKGDRHDTCLACLAGHCGAAGWDRVARSMLPLASFVAIAVLEPDAARLAPPSRLRRAPEARGPPAA
jgi:hypothetical protein